MLPTTELSPAATALLQARSLATLTTLRADGSPHVTPVGFTFEEHDGLARVITSAGSVKARNAARGGRGVLCQVEGRAWLSLEGVCSVSADPDQVAEAERRYAERYRTPRPNPRRVVLLLAVDRVLGWSGAAR